MPEEQQSLPETDPITVPSSEPKPEMNEDYDRIFGGQAHAVAEYEGGQEISFNPDDAFPDIEERAYPVRIHEAPKHQVSQNGNPMMVVTWEPLEPGDHGILLPWRRYMLAGGFVRETVKFLKDVGCEEMAKTGKIQPLELEGLRLVIHVRRQRNNPEYMEVWKTERHPDGPVELV